MFRAAAAGSTSRELRISRPTQEMARVTTTAITAVKIPCVQTVLIPREEASWGVVQGGEQMSIFCLVITSAYCFRFFFLFQRKELLPAPAPSGWGHRAI